MDWQNIVNIGIGTVLASLGWLARQLLDAVQELKEDVKAVEIALPTIYVRKDELTIHFDKLEAMINRIFDKLDSKVDKP